LTSPCLDATLLENLDESVCAMNLLPPDFRDEMLQEATVCGYFHADASSRLDGLPTHTLLQSSYESGGKVWIRLIIDKEDDGVHGHVHCDIGRDGVYEQHGEFQIVTLEQLAEVFARFNGQQVDLDVTAHFMIPRKALPRRGIVSSLLGVGTETCGARLQLDGASFTIASDCFTSLRWEADEDVEYVCAQLKAKMASIINESYLCSAVASMVDDIACFVLETEEDVQRHVDSMRQPENKVRGIAKA